MVNKNNAPYLLAGYNTLSKQDQNKIDLKKILILFRKFHVFLGTSLVLIGLLLTYLVDKIYVGLFLTIYPLITYMWLMWKANRLTKNLNKKRSIFASVILILIVVWILFEAFILK